MRRRLRLEDEYGLRQVELAGDGLHAVRAEAIGFQHDGQRIAAEPHGREDVEGVEPQAHVQTGPLLFVRDHAGIRRRFQAAYDRR